MTTRRWLIVAVLAATLVAAAGCGRVAGHQPVTLQITIHYSQFEETALTVPHGVPVTFVLVNEDPIEHEWLIGDAAFHERHRKGTEAHHGARPSEISLKPNFSYTAIACLWKAVTSDSIWSSVQKMWPSSWVKERTRMIPCSAPLGSLRWQEPNSP